VISTKGMSKAEVLARLYNRSQAQGLGLLHYDPKPMSLKEAQALIDKAGACGDLYFDYLKGRILKIDLGYENFINEVLYDRDNGPGAAEDALTRPMDLGEAP